MKTIVTWMAVLIMAFTFGCTRQEEEGPAEKAGKEVDEAIKDTKEYAGEKMKEAGEAVKDAGEEMEKKE